MKKLAFIVLLLSGILFSLSAAWMRSGKTAYKLHYKGTLHYRDGNFQRAASLFQRAYDMEPDNFNFALSLGLGLGRVGKTVDGIGVINGTRPNATDPNFQQKAILKSLFGGLVHAYAGHFHKAIPIYRRCIKAQQLLDEPKLLSIMHNALGYALLLNQGKGSHGRNNLKPHYHLHSRDMERARQHFETALLNDAANEPARYNYHVLCDSLGVPPKPFAQEAAGLKALEEGNTYRDLPANISKAIAFSKYDEVVFLLDISGSMVQEEVVCQGETRFAVMKETMQLILNNIDPDIRVGIGTIGGDCGTEPRLWYRSDQLTRRELRQHLTFLVPDGTTPLLNILKQSPELFSDSSDTRKTIFLVSDGANICSAQGLDICEWAGGLDRQNITINILTFLETNFRNTNAFAEYGCLAAKTDGRIVYIDNYRCQMERYEFDLVETGQFRIPEFQRVDCWGPAVKDLWAIFAD